MSSETSMVATGFRLQEWAAPNRECQSRQTGMSVASWCADNGITKANYYCRFRRVREVCLKHIQKEILVQQIVPVEPKFLQQKHKNDTRQLELNISVKGFYLHVTESTSMAFFAAVLEVIRDTE
ncbi:IS66 family insertion sequence element accessory protein TnpB [Mediterraneibacter agrestimuris]|uniref:IS66 family insertion sequence element accessory protein TnpB n=1 Tax=Mediterraneibacter agrestimuris TaxID=2941333 RepID=UPI0020410429|nr:IS66 family insertion sequence element accessory protein TnpB [Mediterraneibacter agrestimuris]